MQIFHYHPDTKIYLGEGLADADPLVEENWLIPASATDMQPPDASEGQAAFFESGQWKVQPIPTVPAEQTTTSNTDGVTA